MFIPQLTGFLWFGFAWILCGLIRFLLFAPFDFDSFMGSILAGPFILFHEILDHFGL